ncbi:hypothetical protein [Dasania marina]|uniref:hypothetical protein n=1 Tax=Dasania marina TaxID=471499 RepID=UPI00036F7DFB|nr:hypothetical protein [Dasania marina]
MLKKLASIATGGLGSLFFDVAKTYFPPDMSEQQQQTLKLAFEKAEAEKARAMDSAIVEAEQALTERITQLEGSASDLLRIPLLGTLIIFLRGCQRPLWGFATLYLDFKWFSQWDLDEQQQTALIVINVLVLGFLFGERAIKNVMPLINDFIKKRDA